MERCVERFRRLLTQAEMKLFIIFLPNLSIRSLNQKIIKDIEEINIQLHQKTTNFRLLCIFHIIDICDSYGFCHKDTIDFLELHTTSSTNGTNFTRLRDDQYFCNIIMNYYSFDLIDIRESFINE